MIRAKKEDVQGQFWVERAKLPALQAASSTGG